jgi:GNAT superfamily N-acetyltransferase
VDLDALTQAVLTQRQERMHDQGPSLRGLGSAYFQQHSTTLYISGLQIRPSRGDEVIKKIQRYARERWLGVTLTHVTERDDSATTSLLSAHGFHISETLHLMGRVGSLNPLSHINPLVTVALITSLAEIREYERISQWGFNNDPNPSVDFLSLRSRERWDEHQAQWYRYYLGRLNGYPAGGAYVSLWEKVPTIYGVVTAPTMRGQGIAGQVMTRLVQDTLNHGFGWTCLYVARGNPARRLYEELGYSYLLEFVTYQWHDTYW